MTTSFATAAGRIRGPEIKKAEILVPGLSGGKGTYVIPWKSVPEMFKLTVHDRALHEAIGEAPTFSPRQIRLAARFASPAPGLPAARPARRRAPIYSATRTSSWWPGSSSRCGSSSAWRSAARP